MRLVVLADLHMDYTKTTRLSGWKESVLETVAREHASQIDCLLLAGDNAEYAPGLPHHKLLYRFLRKTFSCPIGLVSGNHDVWVRAPGFTQKDASWTVLLEQLPELAGTEDIVDLETTTLSLASGVIVGTYGHYDASLRSPPVFPEGLVSNDQRYCDWETDTHASVVAKLLRRFADQIQSVPAGKALVTISHTIPVRAAVGHPPNYFQDNMDAYAGTTRLADSVQNKATLHFCGHSHAPASVQVGSTLVHNVGSKYTTLVYLLVQGTDVQRFEKKMS